MEFLKREQKFEEEIETKWIIISKNMCKDLDSNINSYLEMRIEFSELSVDLREKFVN